MHQAQNMCLPIKDIEIFTSTESITCSEEKSGEGLTKNLCTILKAEHLWILFMQVSISSKTIPPRDTTRIGQKPFPRDSQCVQNTSPREKTGSQKAPPPGEKVRNQNSDIHECIHKL